MIVFKHINYGQFCVVCLCTYVYVFLGSLGVKVRCHSSVTCILVFKTGSLIPLEVVK